MGGAQQHNFRRSAAWFQSMIGKAHAIDVDLKPAAVATVPRGMLSLALTPLYTPG